MAKGYIPKWSEETFVIKKFKNNALRTYVVRDPKGKKTFKTFYEKKIQKRTNELKFTVDKK